jgi:hypothetical protein
MPATDPAPALEDLRDYAAAELARYKLHRHVVATTQLPPPGQRQD